MATSTRMYAKARVLGFTRAKRNQKENTSLVQVEGVSNREEAEWYFGKVSLRCTARQHGSALRVGEMGDMDAGCWVLDAGEATRHRRSMGAQWKRSSTEDIKASSLARCWRSAERMSRSSQHPRAPNVPASTAVQQLSLFRQLAVHPELRYPSHQAAD